jgi:hypothetical protein
VKTRIVAEGRRRGGRTRAVFCWRLGILGVPFLPGEKFFRVFRLRHWPQASAAIGLAQRGNQSGDSEHADGAVHVVSKHLQRTFGIDLAQSAQQ